MAGDTSMSCPMTLTDLGGWKEERDEDEEEWDKVYAKLNQDLFHPQREKDEDGWSGFIGGVHVQFPYTPYKSQKQLMSKIIGGLEKGENCLLESPTGTGKTAALLCATLAWLRHCRMKGTTISTLFGQKLDKLGAEFKCTCGLVPDEGRLVEQLTKIKEYRTKAFLKKFRIKVSLLKEEQSESVSMSGTGDGDATSSQRDMEAGRPSSWKAKQCHAETESIVKDKGDLCRWCVMRFFSKLELPKVFYTTRTHNQIQQVVDQLRNTAYKNTRMTILASRKVSCLNTNGLGIQISGVGTTVTFELNEKLDADHGKDPLTTADNNKDGDAEKTDIRNALDETCRQLRTNYYRRNQNEWEWEWDDNDKLKAKPIPKPVCKYFHPKDVLKTTFHPLFMDGAWDIEDLKKEGTDCVACPYYGAQALYQDSEIVFCPYNYIICPDIRDSLGIDLTGSVVIFDEAHNLENICRDAASLSFELDRLDRRIRAAFEGPISVPSKGQPSNKRLIAEHFAVLLQKLSTWIQKNAPKPSTQSIYATPPRGSPSKKFEGDQIFRAFDEIGLGRSAMESNWEGIRQLTEVPESKDEASGTLVLGSEQEDVMEDFRIPSTGSCFVEELLRVVQFLYEDDNIQHFCLILTTKGEGKSSHIQPNRLAKTKAESRTEEVPDRVYDAVFELMCLSPAISFKHIRDNALSVTVASGTLTPFESFTGELETPFNIRLIADHVIQSNQVSASYLHSGGGKIFTLNRIGQADDETQDELGETILQICQTVPYGVLVFLPSYGYMDRLRTRWSKQRSRSSLLRRLGEIKHVFWEERREKAIFERDMERYKDLINDPVTGSQTGCVLFAIVRGKVSEGINFSDNQARAVISVGIPFANKEAAGVKCKKEYNDKQRALQKNANIPENQLTLSGQQWYEIQAFRAINQAFGRCIRHKNDWGCIILLDERFSYVRYKNQLSAWVKSEVIGFRSYSDLHPVLAQFIINRLLNLAPQSKSIPLVNQNKPMTGIKHESDESVDIEGEEGMNYSYTEDAVKSCSTAGLHDQNKRDLPTQIITGSPNDLDSSGYSLDESHWDLPNRKDSKCSQKLRFCDLPTQVIKVHRDSDVSMDSVSFSDSDSESAS